MSEEQAQATRDPVVEQGPFLVDQLLEELFGAGDVQPAHALADALQDGDVMLGPMTREELSVYVRHPHPDLRAAAYQELNRVYGENAPVLAQIYRSMMTDWRNENVELRKFKSALRLDGDECVKRTPPA